MGGVPQEILAAQNTGPITIPSLEQAAQKALAMAREKAGPLVDRNRIRDTHRGPGIAMVNGSRVQMKGNISEANMGPRFVAGRGTFALPAGRRQ